MINLDDHYKAIEAPRGPEKAHVAVYKAVKACCGQGWHEDGYADEYLIDLCNAAIGLLNMESGRLDCRTLDTFYRGIIEACKK